MVYRGDIIAKKNVVLLFVNHEKNLVLLRRTIHMIFPVESCSNVSVVLSYLFFNRLTYLFNPFYYWENHAIQ